MSGVSRSKFRGQDEPLWPKIMETMFFPSSSLSSGVCTGSRITFSFQPTLPAYLTYGWTLHLLRKKVLVALQSPAFHCGFTVTFSLKGQNVLPLEIAYTAENLYKVPQRGNILQISMQKRPALPPLQPVHRHFWGNYQEKCLQYPETPTESGSLHVKFNFCVFMYRLKTKDNRGFTNNRSENVKQVKINK